MMAALSIAVLHAAQADEAAIVAEASGERAGSRNLEHTPHNRFAMSVRHSRSRSP
jgi:hypothetical protein